jgi:peptide/nickel transport system substrate-binding protein
MIAPRSMHRRQVLAALPVSLGALVVSGRVSAQTRSESLLLAVESGQNSLDPQGLGVNQPTLGITWNIYDRLIGFGTKPLPEGVLSYDFNVLVPDLAESWQVSSDGTSVTFKLGDGALFHDGAPVTSSDVKWSLDRAVSNPGPASQMRAGGLESAAQFVVIDAHTIRIDLPAKNPLALPDLAVIQPSILNSALCRQHATATDPWALEWVRTNAAGSGAYKLDSWTPRQETVLIRNEAWRGGPPPAFKQIVIREIPSAGNRRALLLRGDADMVPDLPARDAVELASNPKLTLLGVPMTNTFQYIGMSAQRPPFNDVRVRQAIAYAVPYEKIFTTALHGRGRKLWGGKADPADLAWPQPFPYSTDPDRARSLLREAGLEGGFETTLSYDLGTASVDEPVALFLQEALGGIGIKAAIDKRPPGQVRGLIGRRELPLYLFTFGAWFDSIEYFFFLLYNGANTSPSNGAGYDNAEVNAAIVTARTSSDPAVRDTARRTLIAHAMQDVPYLPLVQPYLNIAAQKDITGFVNQFHRQIDFRVLRRV